MSNCVITEASNDGVTHTYSIDCFHAVMLLVFDWALYRNGKKLEKLFTSHQTRHILVNCLESWWHFDFHRKSFYTPNFITRIAVLPIVYPFCEMPFIFWLFSPKWYSQQCMYYAETKHFFVKSVLMNVFFFIDIHITLHPTLKISTFNVLGTMPNWNSFSIPIPKIVRYVKSIISLG